MADPGGVRIGDAERQRVVDMLRRHTSEGRLTLDEFAERAGEVYAAQTHADLEAVLADLPGDLGPPATATFRPGPGADAVATPRRRRFVGIMSSATARGPWRAPPEIRAFAFWGSVLIDLTNATIESPVVDIRACALMGGVTIRLPEGIPVDVGGFVVMGGTTNLVRNVAPIPGAPLIRVHARGMWGGITIRNPRKKRLRDTLRDHRRDRHERHDRRLSDVHGVVGDAVADAHSRAADALDLARTTIDRALGGPTVSDRIPEMPDRKAEAEAQPAPTPLATPNGDANANVNLNVNANGDEGRSEGPEANSQIARRIPPGTLTILVSDIVGSTGLAERLGDQSWLEVLQAHNAIVRRHVEEHGGTEVKAQGDGFLVVFPSARGAVLSAIAIQRSMEGYRNDNPDVPVTLRLGLHTGEVVATEDDIFGQNVVVATRIADVAQPGEIVVSGLTRDLTASASDLGFEGGEDVTLKGISQPWRVHRVLL